MDSELGNGCGWNENKNDGMRVDKLCNEYILNYPNNQVFSELNYLGPVKICQIEGRGRGLVTTSNVVPGQLIIACTALAVVFPDSAQLDQDASLQSSVEKARRLRESLLCLVQGNTHHQAECILNLHADIRLGFIEHADYQKYIKTATIQQLTERIERICAHNSFEGKPFLQSTSFGNSTSSTSSSFGLWYYPSFLNHTCYGANCHWTIHGNLMVVRAVQNIPAGHELLISYIDPNQNYKTRLRLFLKHDFQCNCQLCSLEQRNTIVRKKIEMSLANFSFEVLSSDVNFDNVQLIQKYIQEIKCTWNLFIADLGNNEGSITNTLDNIYLLKPLIHLGLCHYETTNYGEAITVFQDVYKLCVSISQFTLFKISTVLTVITCILRQNNYFKGVNRLTLNCEYEENIAILNLWTHNLRECLVTQFGSELLAEETKKMDMIVKVLRQIRSSFVDDLKSHSLLEMLL